MRTDSCNFFLYHFARNSKENFAKQLRNMTKKNEIKSHLYRINYDLYPTKVNCANLNVKYRYTKRRLKKINCESHILQR